MKTIVVNAQVREGTGKEVSKKIRAQGRVPAVFYGYKADPVALSVSHDDLLGIVEQERNESVFVKLAMEGGKKKTQKLSILKDYQVNTVKKGFIHADFYEIKMDRELTMDLPIILAGTPESLELGGELSQLKRELKVSGLPSAFPESIEIDVTALGIGESLRVEDVTVPDGIVVLDGGDTVIASVMQKKKFAVAEEAAEEGDAPGAEGEDGSASEEKGAGGE